MAEALTIRWCGRRLLVWAWAALLGGALLAAQSPAPEYTLREESRLVNVLVQVKDANGAPVGGLDRESFALWEEGRPQRIAVFERWTGQPLRLTLAIDTSGSVRKDLEQEREAARRFTRAILRPQDRISLLQFATEVTELEPFTERAARIEHGLRRLRPGPATALYDAISLASERLAGQEGRRALILVSDGGDTVSKASYADALEAALRHEVMIYSLIDVPVEASAGRDTGGEHALMTLAEETGGQSFYVADGGLDAALARVGQALRTQYLLGYYPSPQPTGEGWRRIEATIPGAAPGAFQIRHRTGYYVEAKSVP